MLAAIGPFSLATVALGTAAVGALYALHHLRAQPTRVAVATLVFWRAVARPQRARVAWSRRFSHWPAFLLLSAITLLAAIAMSAGRWVGGRDAPSDAVVVDVGAPMAAPGADGRPLLRAAVDAARADVGSRGDAAVLIAAGAEPVVLWRDDEPLALIANRLASLTTIADASGSARAVELAASEIGDRVGRIDWYTDRDTLPPGLPDEVARRVCIRRQPAAANAVTIVGTTFEASDADALRGRLRVRVAGRADQPFGVTATIGTTTRTPQRVQLIDGRADAAFDDVDCDGQTAIVTLVDAPGAPAAHVVRYPLPRRASLTFRMIGAVPAPLRKALDAIGTTPDGDAIAVVAPGETVPSDAARAIVLLDGPVAAGPSSETLKAADEAIEGLDFEGASVAPRGAMTATATPLLLAGRRVVAGVVGSPASRRLYLDAALFDDAAALPKRAAFPVLMYRLATRLADWRPDSAVVTSLRAADDPLWRDGSAVITTVGEAPSFTSVPTTEEVIVEAASPRRGTWPWAEALLAAALALCLVEAALFAVGKIV